jgi:hypothetical protein
MGQQMKIVRSPYVGGVPDELDVTLRYVEVIELSSTTAANGYVFRGNDTFDPNATGTGLQPAYRDNWAALFYVQQVVSSTITVRMTPNNSTGSVPGIFYCAPSHTTTLNDVDYLRSLPKSQSRSLNFYKPPEPVKISTSTAQIKGVQIVRNQGVGSAVVGATPADQWFWLLLQRSADGAGTTAWDYEVTIDYRVHFSERVPADLSLAHAEKTRAAYKAAQAKKPQGPVQIEVPLKGRSGPITTLQDSKQEVKVVVPSHPEQVDPGAKPKSSVSGVSELALADDEFVLVRKSALAKTEEKKTS